ncbi:MAG: YkgJ family cysteine cluster protein [Phycisphaerae bacterium]|jgi:Fe-S-cluster containining protein|nr:YkgJ family cysteine cluster protein [Phycisphaerae bacterium]
MKSDYNDLEKWAKEKEDENWKFRSFLKFYDDLSDEEIDLLVFKIADEVGSAIDCTRCGRCCQKLKPMCSEQDQQRLAAGLSITAEQLREQYLEYDESDDEPGWRMKKSPCPFLRDKKCMVYEHRPDNCRGYPYLHEPEFTCRTWGMIERTLTCPIVFQVMEKLKEKLNFH